MIHHFDFISGECYIHYQNLKREFPVICNKLEKRIELCGYNSENIHYLNIKEVLEINLLLKLAFETKYPFRLWSKGQAYICSIHFPRF
jgi:hypothetical protein